MFGAFQVNWAGMDGLKANEIELSQNSKEIKSNKNIECVRSKGK